MSSITFKKEILDLLKGSPPELFLAELRNYSPARLLKPLFSGICASDEMLKWHAVTAMGMVVSALADEDMEAGRVVMRRLMWSLNDESGGIGWGAPETIGEILSRHDALALEYCHILVSFMREDGFYLEYGPLQRGLMWGLGRMAMAKADLLRSKDAVRYHLPYLKSEDNTVAGLAAWGLGLLKATEAVAGIESLLENSSEVRLYLDNRVQVFTIGQLARQALDLIKGKIF
ncbi:MAG: HEAT repeat domain-containing protein [Proteobacteria bacterium]|nr:HEAT repeat domain-containing protein [Pseudomonadota bacterium]MBU1716632.1 HEAT repeat domain-containing protein [Pseudomonadota bacterium]